MKYFLKFSSLTLREPLLQHASANHPCCDRLSENIVKSKDLNIFNSKSRSRPSAHFAWSLLLSDTRYSAADRKDEKHSAEQRIQTLKSLVIKKFMKDCSGF